MCWQRVGAVGLMGTAKNLVRRNKKKGESSFIFTLPLRTANTLNGSRCRPYFVFPLFLLSKKLHDGSARHALAIFLSIKPTQTKRAAQSHGPFTFE
jgi:CRISPR/Cas system-associated endonuclease/helicase Cas3